MLSYYNNPKSVDDCTRHIVGKILDQFDLEGEEYHRWGRRCITRSGDSGLENIM
jgi:3-polyprenyl-4-hydroxybenzoate decarboxylase